MKCGERRELKRAQGKVEILADRTPTSWSRKDYTGNTKCRWQMFKRVSENDGVEGLTGFSWLRTGSLSLCQRRSLYPHKITK
jgi:hypothetical protein